MPVGTRGVRVEGGVEKVTEKIQTREGKVNMSEQDNECSKTRRKGKETGRQTQETTKDCLWW